MLNVQIGKNSVTIAITLLRILPLFGKIFYLTEKQHRLNGVSISNFYFVVAWLQIKLCPTSTSAAAAPAPSAATPNITLHLELRLWVDTGVINHVRGEVIQE